MHLEDPRTALYRRLLWATALLVVALVVGSGGYVFIGDGRWSPGDAMYMTVITLSTVGYGEVLSDMDQVKGARAWTVLLIILGNGTLLYYISTLTAFIIEGDLAGYLERNRMQRTIDSLTDHIVICGAGVTGAHVILELHDTGRPFVVIDRDPERIAWARKEMHVEFPFIIGDALEEETLERAGIDRAAGVVATLTDDRDNLFVAVTVRSLNDNVRVVAKSVEPDNVRKLQRVGANAVVSPAQIGGMRLVSEMIRPNVVRFLDRMVRDSDGEARRIEEVPVPPESVGKTLLSLNFRSFTDALVVAVRSADDSYLYNPTADTVLTPDSVLILMCKTDDLPQIRDTLEHR